MVQTTYFPTSEAARVEQGPNHPHPMHVGSLLCPDHLSPSQLGHTARLLLTAPRTELTVSVPHVPPDLPRLEMLHSDHRLNVVVVHKPDKMEMSSLSHGFEFCTQIVLGPDIGPIVLYSSQTTTLRSYPPKSRSNVQLSRSFLGDKGSCPCELSEFFANSFALLLPTGSYLHL